MSSLWNIFRKNAIFEYMQYKENLVRYLLTPLFCFLSCYNSIRITTFVNLIEFMYHNSIYICFLNWILIWNVMHLAIDVFIYVHSKPRTIECIQTSLTSGCFVRWIVPWWCRWLNLRLNFRSSIVLRVLLWYSDSSSIQKYKKR